MDNTRLNNKLYEASCALLIVMTLSAIAFFSYISFTQESLTISQYNPPQMTTTIPKSIWQSFQPSGYVQIKLTNPPSITMPIQRRFKKEKYAKRKFYKQYSTIASSSPFLNRVIHKAKAQLGIRYTYGGTTRKGGFDCSGLVQYSYRHVNKRIPRTAKSQYRHSRRISKRQARAGDLVFFRTKGWKNGITHVGIYLGKNRFLHAPRTGRSITINRLKGYWQHRVAGFGRVK